MKSKEQLLKELIKSNKYRRLVLANRAGFSSVENYRKYLENKKYDYNSFKNLPRKQQLDIVQNNGYQTIAGYMSKLRSQQGNSKVKNDSRTIYNIHILDRSGSMAGERKLLNAIDGINSEIEDLQSKHFKNIKVGIVSFGDSVEELNITDLHNVNKPSYYTMGMTALNDAIGETLTSLIPLIDKDSRAVVKIFTDGGENASIRFTSSAAAKKIKEAKDNNITVVFVGTEMDVNNATNLYELDESNTLVHDNTAESISRVYTSMSKATVNYSNTVSAGGEVLTGFFKDIV